MSVSADRDAPGAWATVALLLATWIMAYVDRMVLLLLVPGIKASFGVSDTRIALLYGLAFSLDFVVAGLVMGRLVDRLNRRNLLVLALLAWSIGAVAGGLSHSFAQLLAARLVIGAAEAVLAPASFSLVADLFAAERRGRPATLLIASASVGAALSNIIGGLLLSWLAARPPLALPGGAALPPWGATMALAGLPGFVLAPLFLLVPEPARRRDTAAPRGGGAFAYLRAHRGLFVPLFLAVACNYVVGYGLTGWYPALLMRVTGLAPATTGLTMGAITLVAATVAGLGGGWLSDRLAARDPGGGRLRLAIMLLLAEMVILLPLAIPRDVPLVLASFALFSTFATVSSSCGYALLPDLVPNELRGQVTAIYQLVANLGGLGLGPTLVALTTDRVLGDEGKLGWSMLIVALPACLLASALYARAVPPARRLRARLEGRSGNAGELMQ